jgi:putative transposase
LRAFYGVNPQSETSRFFQRCLAQDQGRAPEQYRFWRDSVYAEIQAWSNERQGQLTVERMCAIARVSRAGYYRQWADREPEKEDMEVRDAIQKVALEHRRRYGYRRITAELRRSCMDVNHKRVLRLMREDNLLAIRKRKFVLTTHSRHPLKVYVNLAKRMELTAINQLWVADITYIRLRTEFVYWRW